MAEIKSELESIEEQKRLLHAREGIALEKALKSDDAEDYLYAVKRSQNIEARTKTESKALLIDPLSIASSFGYKNSTSGISYGTLRRMAKTPIIRSIIETRVEQVAEFATPQYDRYSTGFVIRRKRSLWGDEDGKVNEKDKKRIEFMTNFMLNGGVSSSAWHADSFDDFIRKCVKDALSMDQMSFEVVRNRGGKLHEFFAVDGATIRIADSYDDEHYTNSERQMVKGYYPSYVQVYNSEIKSEFYPWELCMGVRNPTTNIYNNGYGESELEDLVQTVTSLLWSDQYNANFFRVGSAPKGILKVSGEVNEGRLNEFRQQWMAQMAGVMNSHKLPVVQADKMDFISTQVSNKDMEFSQYQEFLIKISCAMFKIDPAEINFPLSGSADSKPMFEGNNEARLKFSRDKGLRPLLKFVQAKINKYIIQPLDPEFEFSFVGIEEDSYEKDLENMEKELKFMGLNEVRSKRGYDELAEDDVILSSEYLQYLGQKQQQEMMAQAGGGDMGGGDGMDGGGMMDSGDGGAYYGGGQEPQEPPKKGGKDPYGDVGMEDERGRPMEENPIAKACVDYLNRELGTDKIIVR